MEKIIPPSKLYVAKSKIHGLGVFAKTFIKKDEIIEIAPLLITDIVPVSKEATPLFDYLFSYIICGEVVNQVLALGYGCLYNHSNCPNANWRLNESINCFEFYSVKDIGIDEEILIQYGPEEYWDVRKHIDIL